MLARIPHTRLLRHAGLFTWAMVGLPLLYTWLGPQFAGDAGDELALRPMPWQGWASYLAFGAGYAWLTRSLGGRGRNPADYLLLVVLTLRCAAIGNVRALLDLVVMTSYVSLFAFGRFIYKLYVFGHNLDPDAPIKVKPFTPAIFGTKQIANFSTSVRSKVPVWA